MDCELYELIRLYLTDPQKLYRNIGRWKKLPLTKRKTTDRKKLREMAADYAINSDGAVVRKGRMVVTEGALKFVVYACHDATLYTVAPDLPLHFSFRDTLYIAKSCFYWEDLEQDVKRLCAQCFHCMAVPGKTADNIRNQVYRRDEVLRSQSWVQNDLWYRNKGQWYQTRPCRKFPAAKDWKKQENSRKAPTSNPQDGGKALLRHSVDAPEPGSSTSSSDSAGEQDTATSDTGSTSAFDTESTETTSEIESEVFKRYIEAGYREVSEDEEFPCSSSSGDELNVYLMKGQQRENRARLEHRQGSQGSVSEVSSNEMEERVNELSVWDMTVMADDLPNDLDTLIDTYTGKSPLLHKKYKCRKGIERKPINDILYGIASYTWWLKSLWGQLESTDEESCECFTRRKRKPQDTCCAEDQIPLPAADDATKGKLTQTTDYQPDIWRYFRTISRTSMHPTDSICPEDLRKLEYKMKKSSKRDDLSMFLAGQKRPEGSCMPVAISRETFEGHHHMLGTLARESEKKVTLEKLVSHANVMLDHVMLNYFNEDNFTFDDSLDKNNDDDYDVPYEQFFIQIKALHFEYRILNALRPRITNPDFGVLQYDIDRFKDFKEIVMIEAVDISKIPKTQDVPNMCYFLMNLRTYCVSFVAPMVRKDSHPLQNVLNNLISVAERAPKGLVLLTSPGEEFMSDFFSSRFDKAKIHHVFLPESCVGYNFAAGAKKAFGDLHGDMIPEMGLEALYDILFAIERLYNDTYWPCVGTFPTRQKAVVKLLSQQVDSECEF